MPLQDDSAEGALPLATTATSAPNEPLPKLSWESTLSLCPCHREHLHSHPSATSVQVWLLPLNSSSAPGISMNTMGRTAAKAHPTHLWECKSKSKWFPQRAPARPLSKRDKEGNRGRKLLFAARNQSTTSWVWGRAFLEQAMG